MIISTLIQIKLFYAYVHVRISPHMKLSQLSLSFIWEGYFYLAIIIL